MPPGVQRRLLALLTVVPQSVHAAPQREADHAASQPLVRLLSQSENPLVHPPL